MSGGKDRKSKSSNKTQGWEEAGGEFYQESYPADWEGFQRDPAAIATLLPSKQNRYATTRRVRPPQTDTKTVKKRTGGTQTRRRNSASVRRGSQFHDVQVSMLPDLSENLTDEERIWEEIHEIKSMPVSMAQKKEMKAELQNATKLRLQGLDQIKWQRRKVWQQLQAKWLEYLSKMELWKNSLKKIEGNFGTGVVAYFLFLRFLMFLNLFIFLLIFLFVILPEIVLIEPNSVKCDLMETNSTECCSENYFNQIKLNQFSIIDIIQGTGVMENTLMFYGMYTNKIYGTTIENSSQLNNDNENYDETTGTTSDDDGNNSSGSLYNFYYNLPLTYLLITIIYFLISLISIVRSAAREFKDRLVEGEGQFYQYCNLIFGGWDFCIHNEKSAYIKHKALYNEIKGLLHTKKIEYERYNRTKEFMIKLIIIRLLINLFIIVILISAGILIYVLFNISFAFLEPNTENIGKTNGFNESHLYNITALPFMSSMSSAATSASADATFNEQLINLFYEFLPYLGIVCLNLFVPIIFNYLVGFEKYSPMFIIKLTLLRTVFLRLASLMVLLSRFYFVVNPRDNLSNNACYNEKRTPQCWETFVGQQFYKLFITDFVTHFFVTFFINFPRALIAKNIKNKFTKLFGEQEFELSKHVLDIVYSQTLCWLGSFYSPFIPAIATILTFFMFYIKKFACLYNSKPSTILYRASRSNSLFMFVLLLSYVFAIIPIVYSIAELNPSKSCGPFRGLNNVWETAINTFMAMPVIIKNIIFFLGTAGFAIPLFILLTLFLYYYYAVSVANKHMVDVLKNQLILEGHDKQFLLNRLSAFIRQQQEYQRKLKQNDLQRSERQRERDRERERQTSNRESD